jgi:hypothetical protein
MNQQKNLYSSHILHQKQGKANKKDMQVARMTEASVVHHTMSQQLLTIRHAGHQDVNLKTKK